MRKCANNITFYQPMNTAFESEMSRAHLQNLVDSKPDIAREYTISDLLHKIDPSVNIDALAEELMLDIADDFIDNIVTLSAEVARNRNSNVLQAEDVSFAVQRRFGKLLGEALGKESHPPTFVPNEIHQKRLDAIAAARSQGTAQAPAQQGH